MFSSPKSRYQSPWRTAINNASSFAGCGALSDTLGSSCVPVESASGNASRRLDSKHSKKVRPAHSRRLGRQRAADANTALAADVVLPYGSARLGPVCDRDRLSCSMHGRGVFYQGTKSAGMFSKTPMVPSCAATTTTRPSEVDVARSSAAVPVADDDKVVAAAAAVTGAGAIFARVG